MMKTASAKLHWMSPEEGGRQALPSGHRYSTVSRFEKQRETWRKEAWSLVVEWTEPPDASRTHCVNVRFLVDGAPEQLLAAGSRFELMEGELAVATGVVT